MRPNLRRASSRWKQPLVSTAWKSGLTVVFLGIVIAMGALPLSAAVRYVNVNNLTPVSPFTSWTTAATVIQNAVDVAQPGDEVLVTNGVYRTGGRFGFRPASAISGTVTNRVVVTNAITVRSVNGPDVTIIEGIKGIGTNQTRCVHLTNGAMLSGFTLTNGQANFVFLVMANGSMQPVYSSIGGGAWSSSGAVLSNCVIVGNSSGAVGGNFWHCTLKDNGVSTFYGAGVADATLNHCTLQDNIGGVLGGGAYNSILNHCTLIGNSAYAGGGAFQCVLKNCLLLTNTAYGEGNVYWNGGGASHSTLTNCLLMGNSAIISGGGAHSSILDNCLLIDNVAVLSDGGGAMDSTLNLCTLVGNSADSGGGAMQSFLTNCISYFNTSTSGGDNHVNSTFAYSCTTPLPGAGAGNFTNAPLFVDLAGRNLRLASNSPCLNAGDNSVVITLTDLDGRARITGGTVDVGAYEFQPGVSGAFIGWLGQHGLRTDGTDDARDSDGDQLDNFQEWRAGTLPTSALSVLRLLTPTPGAPHPAVRWASVPGKSYFLLRSTNLTTGAGFVPLAQNLPGQLEVTTYTDTNAAAGSGPRFYRVGVE